MTSAVESGIGAALCLALRATSRRVGVAIVYHAVGPTQGNPSAQLVPAKAQESFRRELSFLRRNFDPVPAAKFMEAVASRRRWGRFPVCVTLDDDLRTHWEYALGPLTKVHVPAIFFLSGASLQSPRSFWWERLQRAFDGGVPARGVIAALPGEVTIDADADIHQIAAAIQALSPAQRDEVDERLLRLGGSDPPGAGIRAAGVSSLVNGGHAIGFHTLRHDELLDLDNRALRQALVGGRAELEAVAKHPIDAIAYPHGAADTRVAKAARDAGFEIGFTTHRCSATASTDPMLIGRVSADTRSLGQLALAIAATLLTGHPASRRKSWPIPESSQPSR
jgi:peptidoglycan/xylan/chitin deacetylase (PgdA/CDA1 family)